MNKPAALTQLLVAAKAKCDEVKASNQALTPAKK
jgi:hypothetical protein